ncbi:MAG: hypothetical protein GY898_21185 [Proteobacteria bacterium]|nr:hypothetical protein [Pseudomonadota bacterium]
MIRECRDCSESFAVDPSEQEHLAARNLSLPRRCLGCRAKRRGVETTTIECARCGTGFVFDAKLAVLVQTLGMEVPTRCIVGCDETARKNLRGERKKLAELHERAAEGVARIKKNREERMEKGAVRPEDLFKGLGALLEKAAAEEAAAQIDNGSSLDHDADTEFGLNPKARPGEDVPSPDSLFKSLDDKRKTTG